MSCLDGMYRHPVYGMHQYLPGPYYQQKKIAAYSKMQEALEMAFPTKQEEEEKDQPAEMEYLNSRCVLLTYFHGDIGAVVDEHFSRALSQIRNFSPENTALKCKTGTSRDSPSVLCQRTSLPPSLWTSSYQSSSPACLSGAHPDFTTTATGTFSTPDPGTWSGDNVQTISHPPPESWHYPLASPTSSPYAHMHDVYMYHRHAHPHMHHHHHHHHHLPGSHLEPRYGPLLMPSGRTARIPAPQCDVVAKTEPSTPTMATTAWAGTFHGNVDIVPSFGFETGNSFPA